MEVGTKAGDDPLAAKYDNWSPYHYAFNDPVFWSDPSGAGGDAIGRQAVKWYNEQRAAANIAFAHELSAHNREVDAFANAMYGIFSPLQSIPTLTVIARLDRAIHFCLYTPSGFPLSRE